jgi:hypothetical protein
MGRGYPVLFGGFRDLLFLTHMASLSLLYSFLFIRFVLLLAAYQKTSPYTQEICRRPRTRDRAEEESSNEEQSES